MEPDRQPAQIDRAARGAPRHRYDRIAMVAGVVVTIMVLLAVWSTDREAGVACAAAAACIAALLYMAYAHRRALRQASALRVDNEKLKEGQFAADCERTREARARGQAEELLTRERELFIGGPVVLFRCAAAEGWPIEYISPNVIQFGYDFQTLIEERTPYKSVIHPQDLARIDAARLRGQGLYGMPFLEIDYRIVQPDQRVRRVYTYVIPVYDGAGEVAHYDGYLLDITHLETTADALAEEGERAQLILDSIADAVIAADARGCIESMNPAGEQLTGSTLADAKGVPLAQVFQMVDENTGELLDDFAGVRAQTLDVALHRHATLHRHDGRTLPIRQSIAPLRNWQGATIGAALVLHDMSESRVIAPVQEDQISRDTLTHLTSRSEFQNLLAQALRSAMDEDQAHVCLHLDLDHFKALNNTYGHTAGDQLLREIAVVMRKKLRQSDTLARLGGDEFGVLLWNCSLARGVEIADTLREAVAGFRFQWEDKRVEVRASIGLAPIGRHCRDIATLLSQADVACRVAKNLSRDHIHVFEAGDAELSRKQSETRRKPQISSTMEDDSLTLYYQEIVPLSPATAGERHIEILLRLLDDKGDAIPPEKFMPAAERYSIMPSLERWVVRNTFAWCARRASIERMLVVINVSAPTLSDREFPAFIHAQLDTHGIPPTSICFETTEAAVVSNLASASGFIGALKRMGCRFSLDSFGGGLSSFEHLRALSVDYLKIDGRLVRGMLKDEVDRAVVSAINTVARAMGIATVAEDVENAAILRELKNLKVDYAQGHRIGAPQPLTELEGAAARSARR